MGILSKEVSEIILKLAPRIGNGMFLDIPKNQLDSDVGVGARGFLLVRRLENTKIEITQFEFSTDGKVSRDEYLIWTTPQLSRLELVENDRFLSLKEDYAIFTELHLHTLEKKVTSHCKVTYGGTIPPNEWTDTEAVMELESILISISEVLKQNAKLQGR